MIDSGIINLDKLISAPGSSDDMYIWADYCELVCLISDGNSLSDEEIYRFFYKSKDFTASDSKQPDKDKTITLIRDALVQVDVRQRMISGNKYPFDYQEEDNIIRLKENLNHSQQVYIALLLASNQKYINTTHTNKLTSDFEVISLYVMRKIFPNAVVKLFGSSNISKSLVDSDIFNSTKLRERIPELANLIYQRCNTHSLKYFKERDTGDNGLDIVGFIDLKDRRSSHPLLFGQCACSKEEWAQKQKTTLRNEWSKYLSIHDTSLQNFIFVPFPYLDNLGEWVNPMKLTENVMIDRIRIMKVIDNANGVNIDELNIIEQYWGIQA